MRAEILGFAALMVVAIGVIAFATRGYPPGLNTPSVHLFHGANATGYEVKDREHDVLMILPKKWLVRSQGSVPGFATIVNSTGDKSLSLARHGGMPNTVMIDGNTYNLASGSVFRIREMDNVQNGQRVFDVTQWPFAPLDVTQTYVDSLNEYFMERDAESAAPAESPPGNDSPKVEGGVQPSTP